MIIGDIKLVENARNAHRFTYAHCHPHVLHKANWPWTLLILVEFCGRELEMVWGKNCGLIGINEWRFSGMQILVGEQWSVSIMLQ